MLIKEKSNVTNLKYSKNVKKDLKGQPSKSVIIPSQEETQLQLERLADIVLDHIFKFKTKNYE